jgi:hypothetical protein
MFKTAEYGLGANVYTLLRKISKGLEESHTIHGNLTYSSIILCFVDRSSLCNLVNKANLVHNLFYYIYS